MSIWTGLYTFKKHVNSFLLALWVICLYKNYDGNVIRINVKFTHLFLCEMCSLMTCGSRCLNGWRLQRTTFRSLSLASEFEQSKTSMNCGWIFNRFEFLWFACAGNLYFWFYLNLEMKDGLSGCHHAAECTRTQIWMLMAQKWISKVMGSDEICKSICTFVVFGL